ncbi:MAG: hypothetical protein F4X37_09110 [Acidimicrobiia bacterium]|nr:hypothetical protein [Acidimicrobiia bacterium]
MAEENTADARRRGAPRGYETRQVESAHPRPARRDGAADSSAYPAFNQEGQVAPAGTSPESSPDAAATRRLDEAFLAEQRKKLLAERQRYVRSAETMAAEAAALLDDREPGDLQFDEESGEGDSWAVERERDLALSAAAQAAVELIDAALKRIDDGTYGVCAVSGKLIQKERLRAIPWAAERVEYKAGGLRRR